MPTGELESRPFVQNRPIVYIAGSLIKMGIHSVLSYKIINFLSYLTLIFIIYFTLYKKNQNILLPLTSVIVFICSPTIIHSNFNTLTNLFDAAIFAVFIFTLNIYKDQLKETRCYIFLSVILLISYFILINERFDFTIYLLLSVVLFTLDNQIKPNNYTIFFIFSVIFIIHYSNKFIFPSHIGGQIPHNSLILTNVNPKIGNMVSYFGANSDFTNYSFIDIVKIKTENFIFSAIRLENVISITIILTIFLPLLYKYYFKRKFDIFEKIIILITILHIGVLFAFQFQYRYSIFLMYPALLVAFKSINYRIFNKIYKYLIFVCILSFIFVNTITYKHQNLEITENQQLYKSVSELKIKNNYRSAVMFNNGSSLIWSWLLKDIEEVQYFLPHQLNNIKLQQFHIVIYENNKCNEILFNDLKNKKMLIGKYIIILNE
jgi:hypothetical protein